MASGEPHDQTDELHRENEALARQVKELVKAEGRLYRYQEQLDAQLRENQELYRFNRKLNASLELADVFALAAEFIINHLGYEKVLFLGLDAESDRYSVRAVDGYYRAEEEEAVNGLVFPCTDPLLAPLRAGEPCLIRFGDRSSLELERLADRIAVSEYLVYPLGSHSTDPAALLVVGNSAEKAQFCRRVNDSDLALVGIGNLAGLLSSTIENHILFANTRKALEQERLAEAKYRGIFENAMEGIFRTAPEGRFLSCNPATAEILGYDTPEELMASLTCLERQLYVRPDQRLGLLAEWSQGRAVKDYEVEFYRKGGKRCWVRLSVRPSLDEDGRLSHLDGIMEDISDRKQAEEAIQRLNEELEQRVVERTRELEEANRGLKELSGELESAYSDLKQTHTRMLQQEKMASIGQLAAGVAHEINNPMGFIISNLNSLRKYADKISAFLRLQEEALLRLSREAGRDLVAQEVGEQKRALKIPYLLEDLEHLIGESMEGAERVKKIVQELKSFSRLDESEVKPADLNEGLESTINIVWNELKFKAELKKEYGEIPTTLCHPGQLNQVFMNLLVNAAQAIPSFGVITVRTESDESFIRIAISDTGCGISESALKRIFDPFFTTKEVGKGTGLGLSIAYDIVKKHRGDLQVESTPGKGTTFTMVLPIVAS